MMKGALALCYDADIYVIWHCTKRTV